MSEAATQERAEKRSFNKATLEEFETLRKRYPQSVAALLPTLRLCEREFGCVDEGGMLLAAELIGVSPAYVMGVASFYTHYRVPSDGETIVELCRTLPCALRGADALAEHAQKKLGIHIGETTKDNKITLKSVECMAACDKGPCLQVNGAYHDCVTFEQFDKIVDGILKS